MHARRWLLLGVMCLSLVLVVMAVASLNVAIPALQQDLGATATQVHWIVDAYAIVFAGLLLPAGALGDRYGRKGALLLGLVIFSVGLFFTGIGDSASQVIGGRAIMGVGAAFVMPATLSLITAIFPPEERGKAIATWAGFAGAGGALGPLVSGALLERFWWGSTVIANLPVVVIAIAAIAMLAPRSRDTHATPLDPIGAALSLTGIVALLYGIIEGAERGWSDTLVLGSFAAAAVLLLGFVAWERRSTHPMLPVNLFSDLRLSVGSMVITLTFFVMFAFFFLFTLYLQYVRGYSALGAGVAMLPMPFAFIVGAPRSADLSERFGVGRVIAAGLAAVAVGMAIFAQLTPGTPYLVLAIGMLTMGLGMSAAMAPATGIIMAAIPLDKAGVGSAVNDTTRELGAALGVAVLGTVVGSLYRSNADFSSVGVDEQTADAAGESIGAAWGIAQELPEQGGALLAEAQTAFTDALQVSTAISAVIALSIGTLVLVTLGRRAPSPNEAIANADDELPLLEGESEPAFEPVA